MMRPEESLVVLDRPNPFEPRVIRSAIPWIPNQPLAMYVKDCDQSIITVLDGKVILPEQRMSVIPRAGQQLVLAQDVTGGGGGGKAILRSLAMLAVVAVAIFLPAIVGAFGYQFISAGWAMAAQAAVMVGGSLLVNAILPPPSMKGSKQNQTYGWGGPSMTAQQGLPIPKQYGMMRRAGNVIDSYLTTTLTQQWLNMLIDFGWGPARSLSQIEINGNPLSNYPNIWSEVRLGYNEQSPCQYFSDIVNTYGQNTRLRSADGGVTLVGHGAATEAVEFEFTFPKGLWAGPDSSSRYDPWTVHLQVSYRKVGQLDWTTVLRPRTTAGLPLNAQNQAPYWLAVTSQWTPNIDNTMYVMDVSYGERDHHAGERYSVAMDVPTYDGNGNVLGTKSMTVTGQWVINPHGPGATSTTNSGVNYVSVVDYKSTTHTAMWNQTVLCRDVVRIDHLEPGQYEYKVQKLGASQYPSNPIRTDTEDSTRRGEETWFTQLREIQYDTLAYPNKILLAIRALATDKLSGSALNVTAVADMAATPAMGYKNEVAYDQPLAYYRMSDNGATCTDLTGHGHDGQYNGAPVHGQPALIAGSADAATRLAAGDSVSIAAAAWLPSAWAVECWCNPLVLGGKLISSADGNTFLGIDAAGKINFHFGGADHLSNAAIAAGSPHHVAVGMTPGGFLFLVDGQPQFVALNPPAWMPAQLGGGFAGILDEVAFYGTIQPGRLKQHYITGSQGNHSVLEDRSPDNPTMVGLDMLLNPIYAGQQPPSLIDVEAFRDWADFNDELVSDGRGGQIYRHIFNGVFDQTESLWAALGKVGQMSRTVLLRTGTQYTCVCDKPATRTQLFTMGNIKQDSFKQSWPALLDRANAVSGTFLDETDNWAKTPIRVMDETAIAAGAPLQEAGSVDLFGITNPRAAWRELMYRLLASKAALQTVQLECALEGLAAHIGDVVGVQHDVPQWGAGGRILRAIAAGKVQLDQKVTIEPNVQYVLMMILPSVLRAQGVVQSVLGNIVSVQTAWDGVLRVRRLLVDGRDIEVKSTSVANGVAYLSVASMDGILAGQACSLYDVDAIETHAVSNGPGTTDVITLATPFSVVPEDYSTYFFGQLSDIQDFRISAVGRRSDQEMTLQLTKYDPLLYGDLEPSLPEASAAADQIAVSDLQALESGNASPETPVVNVTWHPGKMTAGVRIYLTRDGYPEYLARDVKGRNYERLSVVSGVEYTVRVVGYDSRGYSAPHESAPTTSVTALGVGLLPANVANLYASACAADSVTLNWAANPAADNIDHYEVRYAGTVTTPVWDLATPLTPNPGAGATSATFGSGPGQYMMIAVNVAGYGSSVATSCLAVLGGSAGGTGGGGYGGGGYGCFSGNVEIETPEGWKRFDALPQSFRICNDYGDFDAELEEHDFDGTMIDFTGDGKLVTMGHLIRYEITWRPASMHYRLSPRVAHHGKVYNASVKSAIPGEQNFRLRNGDVAHNLKALPDESAPIN